MSHRDTHLGKISPHEKDITEHHAPSAGFAQEENMQLHGERQFPLFLWISFLHIRTLHLVGTQDVALHLLTREPPGKETWATPHFEAPRLYIFKTKTC